MNCKTIIETDMTRLSTNTKSMRCPGCDTFLGVNLPGEQSSPFLSFAQAFSRMEKFASQFQVEFVIREPKTR
jgi:hypothetical protein